GGGLPHRFSSSCSPRFGSGRALATSRAGACSMTSTIRKRDALVRFPRRALYLTEDKDLLARQLNGEVLAHDPARKLIDNISTDELTPGWVCFWYDETLGDYCLVGLRGGVVGKDSIKNAKASVVVSGLSKG